MIHPLTRMAVRGAVFAQGNLTIFFQELVYFVNLFSIFYIELKKINTKLIYL
jgi:hypothetical protein